MIEFAVDDAQAQGYLALPPSGRGPGVLVLHAWWGLNEVFTGLCDRLAAEGFVAFAPDLYGGRIATTVDDADALNNSLPFDAAMNTLRAATGFLRDHSAVTSGTLGAVGFSMGAYLGSLLATAFEPTAFAAVVLFYGAASQLEADDYRRSHAAFQGHFAPRDPWATDDEVGQAESAIRAAGKAWNSYRYDGTRHWFFEPNRPEYDPDAAQLAWERTVAFLKEHLRDKRGVASYGR